MSQYARYFSLSGSGGGGVTSLNGETGALNLIAGTGISITPVGTNITIANTGGTVTSVALSDGSTVPLYSISGSPVTSAGTLTFTLNNQSANTILAGPTTGAAAQPTFRALVAADIPSLSYANQALSNLTNPTSINQNLVPNADNTFTLGSSINSWANLQTWGANFYDCTSRWFGVNKSTEYLRIQATDSTPFTTPSGATAISVIANHQAPSGTPSNTLLALVTTTGSSASTTGSINIETGNNTGAGNSGNINLILGTAGGTRGNLVIQDGSQGTIGNIWTSTTTTGAGHWAPNSAAGAITALTGDVTATGPGSVTASLTAITNSTITTLSALSLPYSQITGAPTFANQSLSNLTNPTAINQDLIPTSAASNSLGSISKPWQFVWADDFLVMNNANNTFIGALKNDGSNNMQLIANNSTFVGSALNTNLFTSAMISTNNSGNILNSTGTTVDGNSGAVTLQTGNSTGLGNSGNILLKSGTVSGGTRGQFQIQDGSEGTSGQVWTSTDSFGSGHWAPAATLSNPIQLTQIATPATPPSGSNDLYFKPTSTSAIVTENLTAGSNANINFTSNWVGQSFTPTSTNKITSIIVQLAFLSGTGTTGNVVIGLYSDSSGSPGTLLETSSPVDSATFTSSMTSYTFNFAGTTSLTSGTIYHLVINPSSVTFGGSTLQTNLSGSNPYAGGNYETSTNSGVTWTPQVGDDLYFIVSGNIDAGGALYTLNSLGSETLVGGGGGSGTVTSVALAAPSIFNVSGSPITTTGTLALTYSGTALPTANGGTNVTSAGTAGNLLVSDGTNWTSAPISVSSSFAAYTSSQVNTDSTTISSSTFTTFSNSPALTFTPTITGTYKVYCSIPLQANTGNSAIVRIINTSGSAILLAESQAAVLANSGGAIYDSAVVQSTYTLTAGNTYVFDIQGNNGGSGSILNRGTVASFYMFAEGIALANNSGLDFFTSTQISTSDTGNSTSSYVIASNSPGFSITPNFSGKYRVWAVVPLECGTSNQGAACQVQKTSGTGVLLTQTPGFVLMGATGLSADVNSVLCESFFTLIGGQTVIFDIYNATIINSGNTLNRADLVPFYMYAQRVS